MTRYALVIGLSIALGGHLQAWAQQPQPNPIDSAMKAQLGELTFNNTILLAELKRVSEENAKLKAELETLKKGNGDAKQDAKDGKNDGSGGAQPSVR